MGRNTGFDLSTCFTSITAIQRMPWLHLVQSTRSGQHNKLSNCHPRHKFGYTAADPEPQNLCARLFHWPAPLPEIRGFFDRKNDICIRYREGCGNNRTKNLYYPPLRL